MSWQFLIAIYLLLGTASYILQRRLGKSLPTHKRLITGFFFLVVHYPMGLFVAAFSSPDLAIGWVNAVLLLVGCWVFPVINLITLRASKDIDAGLFAVISNLTPIITIVAASVLLHENLDQIQLIGAIVILSSAFLATLLKLRNKSKSNINGLTFAVMAVTLAGLATVYERYMLTKMDFGAYLVFGWGAQALWTAVFTWPQRRQLKLLRNKKRLMGISAYAMTSSLKGIVFVAALGLTTNVSLLSAFTGFLSVLVVGAAYFALKERYGLGYRIGAGLLGAVGIVILNM